MMKKTDYNGKMDERQREILSEALAASALFAYFYEVIIIIFKLVKIGDVKTTYIEIGLICIMVIGMTSYYIVTSEYDNIKEKTKKEKRRFFRKPDERQRKRLSSSLAAAAFFAYFYELFVIIFKLIRTKDIKNIYIEVALLVMMSIIINLYHIKKKEYSLPKTFFGRILPLGNAKGDKKSRYRNYLLDSLIMTIIFVPVDIISKRTIVQLSLLGFKTPLYLINSLLRFLIFLTINYLWGEYNIKRYNIYYESLQDDED